MNLKKFHFALVLGLSALAAQAAPAAPASDRLKAACMAADFNHDGSVSREEFHQDVLNSWRALHPDASGYIAIAGLASVPGLRRGMIDRLKRADADGDGKLSFKEVALARMAYFEAADSNSDDLLSVQECMDHQRRMAGAPGKAGK